MVSAGWVDRRPIEHVRRGKSAAYFYDLNIMSPCAFKETYGYSCYIHPKLHVTYCRKSDTLNIE